MPYCNMPYVSVVHTEYLRYIPFQKLTGHKGWQAYSPCSVWGGGGGKSGKPPHRSTQNIAL